MFVSGKGVDVKKLACKYHPDAELIEDYHAGDMVCPMCGLVVGDRVIDVGNEWRTFNDGESKDMCRVGGAENPLYEGHDLSTNIQQLNNFGKSEVTQIQTSRKSKTTKLLDSSFSYIKEISNKMCISRDVMENAMYLFKSIREKNSLKGKDKEAVMASCLYIECRRTGVSRTMNELSANTGISKKLLGRVYKFVFRLLENKEQGSTNVADFMSRFCNGLGLPFDVVKKARQVALKVTEKNIAGGSAPTTIASAAIFIAAELGGNKKTCADISSVTGVTEGAIKQCLKLLLPYTKEIYPIGD